MGGWIKAYNEEPHNLYSSPNIIIMINWRRKRWARLVAHIGEEYIQCFGRRVWMIETMERPGYRGEGNIKTDLRGIGWGCGLGSCVSGWRPSRAFLNTVTKLRVP
jgi:hypothetical protein